MMKYFLLVISLFIVKRTYAQCTNCCPVEAYFAIDSSNSVPTPGLAEERLFVSNVILNGLSECSSAGALHFAKGVTSLHALSDDLLSVVSAVNNMPRHDPNGQTWHRDAMIDAIAALQGGDPAISNVLILITDGKAVPDSTQSPCLDNTIVDGLVNNDIRLVIVEIGTFDNSDLSCLTSAPVSATTISVDDFSDLQDIIDELASVTECQCPEYSEGVDCTIFHDECLTCGVYGCESCNYEYELFYDEGCCLYRCEEESCGPEPDACQAANVDSDGCPIPCDTNPCDCNGSCQHCDNNQCHFNGCDQCESGYFKKNYNYPCIDCQLTFGDACMFCQDFNGCGQCKTGYNRVWDNTCGLWKCQ